MRRIKQIDFTEALERARKGENVYAVDFKTNKAPTTKLFKNLVIGDALTTDYIYQIVEEVDE